MARLTPEGERLKIWIEGAARLLQQQLDTTREIYPLVLADLKEAQALALT
jgi:hypothetical protein